MKSVFRRFLVTMSAGLFIASACGRVSAQGISSGTDKGLVCKVVLDPGHGGKDPGCVYKNHYEKDLTLSIAKKVGSLIKENYPEVEVIYTRTADKYIELAERGRIANQANADLFISIHINSATNQSARGTSTHVMGMDKSGKNLEVAMRENDIIIYEDDYTTKYEGYNPGDPASYIMFSLMQYAYQDQSMMFAETVQKHYRSDLPMPDRGTTQEPFLVLWRTSMPSVLTEVGFLSNQTDRSYITTAKGQNEAARSLFNAFSEYKVRVEGRAGAALLSPEGRTSATLLADSAASEHEGGRGAAKQPETRLVGQKDYEGVLFYVQISFLGSRKPANDPCFKSYRNRVVEKRVPGKGYRYLIGGLCDYKEIVKIESEARREFPDAFVVAYDGDRQVDVKAARRGTGR